LLSQALAIGDSWFVCFCFFDEGFYSYKTIATGKIQIKIKTIATGKKLR
jgi:hypothetical protein